MSDPIYDLVQVDKDGRIMDYMVREDIMSIAREAVPPSDGGGGIDLPLAGTDVTAVVEGGSYTAQELFELYYSLIIKGSEFAYEANVIAYAARADVAALEARVAALEAGA